MGHKHANFWLGVHYPLKARSFPFHLLIFLSSLPIAYDMQMQPQHTSSLAKRLRAEEEISSQGSERDFE